MNLADSSAWLEYFAGSPNADLFADAIEDTANLLVPSIVLLEVFKHILRHRGEDAALRAVAHMRLGQVIDLDTTIALSAAKLGCDLKLPLADSVIVATARSHNATVWTQDADFNGLPEARYFPKAPAAGR